MSFGAVAKLLYEVENVEESVLRTKQVGPQLTESYFQLCADIFTNTKHRIITRLLYSEFQKKINDTIDCKLKKD